MSQLPSHDPSPHNRAIDYSLDQLALSNERTYAAWLRTGISALAAGVAIEKFIVEVLPGWGVRGIAMILILMSGVAFGVAGWRFTHLGVRLEAVEVKTVPTKVTTLISVLLITCSVLALIGLWVVDGSR